MLPRLLFTAGPLAAAAALAALAGLAACASSTSDAALATEADAAAIPDGAVSGSDGEAGAIDNGAPSTTYPAPHPALPELVNGAKGPVLTSPKIVYIVYPNDPHVADLEGFARKLSGSTYWASATGEYGVGALSYTGMIELTGETAPKTISSAEVRAQISDALTSGKLGVPDPQTIYTIVYPSGTTITEPNPITTLLGPVSSCQSFLGYHDNVTIDVNDAGVGTKYAFAVIPTCPGELVSITDVMSHEWVEASTDPELNATGALAVTGGPTAAFYAPDTDHTVWSLLGGGEAGDLCNASGPAVDYTPPELGYMVQRTWSNVAARAGHDPCVPHIAGSYFAAAPVLTQPVSFSTSFTGSVTTKGIVIPVGASKTIEVDLFSDGPLAAPMKVKAQDVLASLYGAYGFRTTLAFKWDRTQGVNGEKLHLTVTVTDSSFLGGAHAFMIAASQGNRLQLWPGLVVEQ